MGLDPARRSDSWAAFCFDEACFMWGRHVEAEIREGTKKAKNDQQFRAKAIMVFNRLMAEPEPETSEEEEKPKPVKQGQFRDPAAFFKKE